MDWTLRSGKTPSRNTGPTTANNDDQYLYLEASRNKYETAKLNTGCIDLSGLEKPVFSIAYHMYGSHMGSFSIKINENGGAYETLLFKEGNQGNVWNEKEFDLSNYAGKTVDIQIEGTIGYRYKSDIAIDGFFIGEKPEPCVIPEVELIINHVTCNGLEDGTAEINVLNYDNGYLSLIHI